MDFAKKLLGKYGWKEGEGLGKDKNGISKPIKASLKFNNEGLGANQATSDFNNHWWDRVFNEAANNMEVKKDQSGIVSLDMKDENNTVEITTKGYSMKKFKKAKESRANNGDDVRYKNFFKSSTLTNTGDEKQSDNGINMDEIAVTQHKVLSDEELFRACQGRTAHKGARHGLKSTGKLSRIERQDEELLARMQSKYDNEPVDSIEISKPKKSKRHIEEPTHETEMVQTIKTKKSKKRRKSEDAESVERSVKMSSVSDQPKVAKKSKPTKDIPEELALITKKCKKSKKKKKEHKDQ